MKPLQLSDTHKSILLEMCKKLYPEYTKISFGNNHLNYMDSSLGSDYIIFNLYKGRDITKWTESAINWFEFCTTYLFDKLFTNCNWHEKNKHLRILFEGVRAIHYGGENQDHIHPVDYLYNYFKLTHDRANT